jgi:hypothetical protein
VNINLSYLGTKESRFYLYLKERKEQERRRKIMRRFVICTLYQVKFYLGDQMKEDEICSSVCRSW